MAQYTLVGPFAAGGPPALGPTNLNHMEAGIQIGVNGDLWASYSPATVGIGYGTGGTLTSEWRYGGGAVVYHGSITLGSGGTITDSSISLPVTPRAGVGFEGDVYAVDSSDSYRVYALKALYSNPSGTPLWIPRYLTGSPVSLAPLSNTAPFTWATGDQLNWSFRYDPA